jgi:hypothetical protein
MRLPAFAGAARAIRTGDYSVVIGQRILKAAAGAIAVSH